MLNTIKFWWEEAQWVYEQDPSCKSVWQALLLFPGLKARRYHTLSHWFYQRGHYFIARYLSERASRKTGIEIHPGATIGNHLFIDHGTGVVIGETVIIGDRVTIFHGVTLGGTGKTKGVKRHPTVEDDVIIGAGATVLGDVTLHRKSKIGAGAVVLKSVPENVTAVGIPAVFYPKKDVPQAVVPIEWMI
ncbi:serine O-acetyltransferase [Tuanshanicoccus lijuaniae]|uniref:serine O-acetyltransferase n=1 Tax=Aerococcaceae bacterium zg-1292 TaxID=2774330 RepID=UPI001937A32E|nr:serine O-acetyltransferase [Aerococcaceae bacterium zg-1292]MBS4457047.1 serine O-acetyltransferase [Aerococcaceae bacterium zg-A91]MBS4458893.1 serine O-acetyltransferase [Aerococcaceae bacterium zg-BR33]QQA37704.1 serine O-acetyltransferase [Aerococcaceae bacterium zg-1292]